MTMDVETKVNILMIDDAPDKLLALETILDDLGQNLVRASSGREGLRHLLSDEFAVILLDVNMPEMDGFETAALIRQRGQSEHTPIIFITAFSDETHISRGYSLGAVDYIQTPVVPEILRAKVAVFVDLFRKTELVKRQAQQQVALAHEQAARAAAEEATRRSQFLAEAATVLGRSLDYNSTVASAAQVVVPVLGDAAVVTVLEGHEAVPRFEVAGLRDMPSAVQPGSHPLGQQVAAAAQRVLASGKSELLTRGELASGLACALPLSIPALASAIVAPLGARGAVVGVLAVARFDQGQDTVVHQEVDLRLAEDLAGRAAIAIEHARLYQEIRDGDRRKDEFLAMLGHELRNPLGAVSNALQCLDLAVGNEAFFKETRQILDRQVHHMARLVDDLLDVSRITRGKIRLQRERLDLKNVIERAVAGTQSFIHARRHRLSVNLPEAAIPVDADQTRLEQIFSNLLHNAAKYSESGGSIALSVETAADHAIVRIRDSGLGIQPDLLPRVFDLFTQADRSLDRSQGGLGIGLTLARSLVQMHGGEISAASDGLGRGSEFCVKLPTVPAPQLETLPAANGTGPAKLHAQKHRILLVDDNVDLGTALATLLRAGGHEVHIVHDAIEALEAMTTLEPTVALIDIGLPGMNGYELAQRIREQKTLAATMLVAITGYGQAEDRHRSQTAGFDHHLVKPVGYAVLQQLLASAPAHSIAGAAAV